MATCRDCGGTNPDGTKFCETCGAPQSAACVSCGAVPSNPAARFCPNCGQPLAGSSADAAPKATAGQAPAVAERRVCSILFADLVGFTPLSESRDAEEVRELLTHYFDATRTVIARYGGTVEKFIGDAVMAVWGAPVAAEGDAERAVRAALDVVDAVTALGEQMGVSSLAARCGVVTGEVAVTLGAEGQGMVAGDPVNTAARVQSAAAPGAVLVDTTTRRVSAASIAFDDAGAHMLKGKAEPEQLWRPTRVLAGVGGAQRVDGLEAPLIGRNAELRTVKELFHASIDRSTPRLVVLTGAAGVGKSRLGWDFEKYVDGLAIESWWHRGRCLSYGEGVSYWALAQAVRARLDIAEDDSQELAASKLADGLDVLIPDPAERGFIAARLKPLLGLPAVGDDGATLEREDLFAGWRLLFERLAASSPLVWLVEDAQYADQSLLDFIDHLIDWTKNLPIIVVVFGRNEITEEHSGFGVGRNRTLMVLDPLDEASMHELVEALVPGMPARVRTTITEQAQGVPLYAVETIRSLIDRDIVQPIEGVYRLVGDIGELDVPDSLHGLLAARLDALSSEVRALVADAAVLGTTFPAEALVAISGQDPEAVRAGLAELVRREVLVVSADRLSPERGSYRFAQQLVKQVAYDTLSRRDRKARHLQVAAHLRSSFPDDGEEVADAIARHYRDALAAVPDDTDADEIRGEAIAISVRAGARAKRIGALRAATDAYAAAAALAEEAGDATAGKWWELAVTAADEIGDYDLSLEHSRSAQRFYESHGDDRSVARARALAGRALRLGRRHSEAREELAAALDVLRTAPDQDTLAALTQLAALAAFAGSDSTELVAESLALMEALDVDSEVQSLVFINAGIAAQFRSQLRQGSAYLREAARLAEQSGARFIQVRALSNLVGATAGVEPEPAVQAGRRSVELARLLGARDMLGYALGNLADALLLTGDWDGAARLMDEAIEIDGLDDEAVVQVVRAHLAGLRGDPKAAAEVGDIAESYELSEEPQDRAFAAFAAAGKAMADGDWPTVLAAGTEAIRDLEQLGGFTMDVVRWPWCFAVQAAGRMGDRGALENLISMLDGIPAGAVPRIVRGQAMSMRAHLFGADDPSAAGDLHDEAVRMLRAAPSPYHLALALIERGRSEDLDEARTIAQRLGARPLLELIDDRGTFVSV